MKFCLLLISVFTVCTTRAQDSSYRRQELIYGRKDGLALTMVMLQPKNGSNARGLISLVSGDWFSNYRMEEGYEKRSAVYADSGYTVFMVMHSSQPRYAIDEQIPDIKRAIRFVRFHAAEYSIDPNHIGITGSSSGGHLTLSAALDGDDGNAASFDPVEKVSSRVQAVAVFFPPVDFLNWGTRTGPADAGTLKRFGVAGAFDFKKLADSTGKYEHVRDSNQLKTIAEKASPIHAVSSDDPPVMIAHGDADPIVPLQQSQLLISALQNAGVPCELIIHKNGSHGWRDMEVEQAEFLKWFGKWLGK